MAHSLRSISPHPAPGRSLAAHLFATAFFAVAVLSGCSSKPDLTHTGFLSDYSALKEVNENKVNYVSGELSNYRTFIVDPVQIRSEPEKLSAQERAEVATYFREAFTRALRESGYTVTETVGAETARVRIALTGVNKSTWWKKIHPASSLAGAGRGGAAMEGEVIDATTGRQLAAVVQSGVGSQFTMFNYSTLSDLKSTIDGWAKTAVERLNELRTARTTR